MPRTIRNLSISILRPSGSQDFTFDSSFDQTHTYGAPPMSAPPTTLHMPKDLFPLSEACESCDACTALAGEHCRNSDREMNATNGLGSAYSTRRRTMLDSNGASSPSLRTFGNSMPVGQYRRQATILPARHRGVGCRVPNSMSGVHGHVSYDTPRSTSMSNESTPATTPTDERSSTGLDSTLRSMSLGSLSLGSASTLDLSANSSPTKSSGPRFRLLDKSFF